MYSLGYLLIRNSIKAFEDITIERNMHSSYHDDDPSRGRDVIREKNSDRYRGDYSIYEMYCICHLLVFLLFFYLFSLIAAFVILLFYSFVYDFIHYFFIIYC